MLNFYTVSLILLLLLINIQTLTIYKSKVKHLESRTAFWRNRAQDLEAQIIKETNRG